MMKMKNIKAIFRRGQSQASSKSEQGQLPGQIREDLSRSSSVTNLNADNKNKGAFSKLRKSASKDKLDKLTDKKNEKKGIPSNNNKLDSAEVDHSLESLQEIELLQRQLTDMAKEKTHLALELSEHKGELQILKSEIVKLKMFQDQSNVRIEQLNDENTSLRNRLRDVAHSPLSDNEKQQLLDSHRHSSAPASIATNVSLLEDGNAGDITACPTPDWDKHSSSNVSDVSVACLQDKINQMQETHYSTNEELQATLQELTDLQRQLTELQQDNERLLDEKNLMFDSLCRQTERLNDARAEVESLKQLLYRDKDETGQFESIVDREQKLVDLLKSAQEERETLLVKQEQLNNELQDARTANIEQITEIEQLTERVRTLESTLDAKHAEHRQLDQELAIAKDQCSGRQIEINRLTDLLENARTKINELEQERALNDKSELDELLDNARKEKDALESEVANLKEQVARSRNETDKLREQVSILQEECKVTRNNAKCTQSELEYKCEKLTADKTNLNDQLQQLQDAANELQVQSQCQLEDKRQLSSVLSETQRNLSEAERKNTDLGTEIEDLKRLRKEENEEWEKFQNDLLTSVRVANDFKSEAQQELQKMIMENKAHRERVRQLEAQIDKLKGMEQETTSYPYASHVTGFPKDVSKVVKETIKSPSMVLNETRTLMSSSEASDEFKLDRKHEDQLKDGKGEQNRTYIGTFRVAPPVPPGHVKEEPEKNISGNTTKKSSIFLPVLSIISRNKSQESLKETSSAEKLSNDVDGNKNLTRYADSSKIINSSGTEPVTEKFEKHTVRQSSESNIVKKRKATKSSQKYGEKRLSGQEEKNLAILYNLYSQIDQNTPEEQLTEEQKFILKVKDVFDNDTANSKLKPVAKKPKDKLAISKPLLDSVLNNPKLKEITEDRRMVHVESDSPETYKDDPFSSEFKEFVANDPNFSKRYEMILKRESKFDDLFQSNIEFNYYDEDDNRPKSVSSFKPEILVTKSKSLDNIYYKNYVSNHEINDDHPSSMISEEEKVENPGAITFETLDVLYAKIDHNIPENELTKEEKFVIKLKQSLDEMGRKSTLRKMALKSRKNLEISEPTETSILLNPKLVTIINDPKIKMVEHHIQTSNEETQSSESSVQIHEVNEEEDETNHQLLYNKSISYEDILKDDFEFKLPRAKLIRSTPNIPVEDRSEPPTEEEMTTNKKYIKNQEEHLKRESAPFYRVKRAYDLQILRPSFDRRKISLNEPESDSEGICILDNPKDLADPNNTDEDIEDDLEYDPQNIAVTHDTLETIQETYAEEPNHPKTLSNSSSLDEEVLSSLKSKLDEDEFELIQRIQSSSDFSRPNSGLNEEDLKLIAFAQQQCSQEEDSEGLGANVKKDSGLSEIIVENPEIIVDCYNKDVKDVENGKIGSSSLFENTLSFQTVNSGRSSLQEPIYANYSIFLKQMIHEDVKDVDTQFVTKKQPLPLPRSVSMKEDPTKATNKIESDNSEQNFDNSDIFDIVPISPIDICKITRDISNLTSSLNDLEDLVDLEDITHQKNQIMFTGSKTFIATRNTTNVLPDEEQPSTSAKSELWDDPEDDSLPSTNKQTPYVTKSNMKVFGDVEKFKVLEFITDLEAKIKEDEEEEPENTPESSKGVEIATSAANFFDDKENSDVTKKPIAEESLSNINKEEVFDDEAIEALDEPQLGKFDIEDTYYEHPYGKTLQTWNIKHYGVQTASYREEKTLSLEDITEESQHFSIPGGENKYIEKFEPVTQAAADDSSSTTTGFSICGIMDKLGHIIQAVTTSTTISTKDIITQTEPVIVEHHVRSKRSKKKKHDKSRKESRTSFDSLERIAAFHILNNPPVPHVHVHPVTQQNECPYRMPSPRLWQPPNNFKCPHGFDHNCQQYTPDFKNEPSASEFRMPTNRTSIEDSIKKFESIIQNNNQQQSYDFKSDTLKAAFNKFNRTSSERASTQTEEKEKEKDTKKIQILENVAIQVPNMDVDSAMHRCNKRGF